MKVKTFAHLHCECKNKQKKTIDFDWTSWIKASVVFVGADLQTGTNSDVPLKHSVTGKTRKSLFAEHALRSSLNEQFVVLLLFLIIDYATGFCRLQRLISTKSSMPRGVHILKVDREREREFVVVFPFFLSSFLHILDLCCCCRAHSGTLAHHLMRNKFANRVAHYLRQYFLCFFLLI